MEYIDELKELVNNLEVELAKYYYTNNQAAGKRAKKYLREIKSVAQKMRVRILAAEKD